MSYRCKECTFNIYGWCKLKQRNKLREIIDCEDYTPSAGYPEPTLPIGPTSFMDEDDDEMPFATDSAKPAASQNTGETTSLRTQYFEKFNHYLHEAESHIKSNNPDKAQLYLGLAGLLISAGLVYRRGI